MMLEEEADFAFSSVLGWGRHFGGCGPLLRSLADDVLGANHFYNTVTQIPLSRVGALHASLFLMRRGALCTTLPGEVKVNE